METARDTKSKRTLFDRANSIFKHSHHNELCIFTSVEEDPACCAHKNLHQYRLPTVTVTTTVEAHHLPSPCVHIHSINIQQMLLNVSVCIFFLHGGIHWHLVGHHNKIRGITFGAALMLPTISLSWHLTLSSHLTEINDNLNCRRTIFYALQGTPDSSEYLSLFSHSFFKRNFCLQS